MNTKLLRSLAGSTVLVAALSLTACGGDDDTKPETTTSDSPAPATDAATEEPTEAATDTPTEADTPTESTDEAPTPEAGGSNSAALDQIVKSQQDGLKQLIDSSGGMFEDVQITSEGDNTLVYTYVLGDTFAAAGASALESTESTYDSLGDSLLPSLESAGIKNPVVKFVFNDTSGKEIWSTTVKK